MPLMKITVSFAVPDSGLHVLKRCAYLLERPFYGFLKSLVERQSRWAPQGERIDKMDLGIEIETAEGERACREIEQQQLRETRELLRRVTAKGWNASSARSIESECTTSD
ncbi:MAG TPA: hypothetical protein VN878_00735 [Usitatibacter sp.]|nr:hypothetical protein [Usitatibacter sp.]